MNPLNNSVAYRAQQAQLASILGQFKQKQAEEQQARSTFEQIINPIVGSIGNTFGGALGGVPQIIGSGIEALTPWNGVGQNIRNFGTDFRGDIEGAIASSPYSTQARPGENSFLVNVSSGLGSLASSLAMRRAAMNMGVGAGMASALPAAAFGASAGGRQAQAASDAGKGSVQSFLTGLGAGGAEAALEKIGLDKYAGAAGSLLPRMGIRMASEGLQEGAQSLAGSAFESTYGDVNPWDALKQAAVEAGYGAIVGGLGDVSIESAPSVRRAMQGKQFGLSMKDVNDGFTINNPTGALINGEIDPNTLKGAALQSHLGKKNADMPNDPRQQLAMSKVLKDDVYDVGITNVAGKNITQSDLDWQSAIAKGIDLAKTSAMATDYGRKQILQTFQGSGINVKSEPGFGVFEENAEPSIDMKARVNDKQAPTFFKNLADLGENKFAQTSVIAYRNAQSDKFGWVDKKRGISNEPLARIRLSESQDANKAKELNELLNKYDLAGASVKDRGKTLDISNLSYYNENYEQFRENIGNFIEELESRGLLESFDFTIAEVRHFGQEGEAPTTYERVRSEFTEGKDIKTDQTVASRFIDYVPKKEMTSRSELEQLLNKPDIPEVESRLARRVIDSIDWNQNSLLKDGARGGRIPTGLFISKMQGAITPTTTEDTERWADYGLDNLNLGATSEAHTTKIKVPIDIARSSDHFGEKDNFGHFRWFELENPKENNIMRLKDRRNYLAGEIEKGGNFKDEIAQLDKQIKEAESQDSWEYDKTAFVLEKQADSFQKGLIEPRTEQEILESQKLGKKQLKEQMEKQRRVAQLAEELAKLKTKMQKDGTEETAKEIRDDLPGWIGWQEILENSPMFTSGKYQIPTVALERLHVASNDMLEGIKDIQEKLKNHEQMLKDVRSRKPGDAMEQMQNFAKDNKYRRRLLEETLIDLQKRGFKYAMLPTPSTAAGVEWNYGSEDGNGAPYENADGDRVTPNDSDFQVGDTITYGGEDMTVVQSSQYDMVVAPADKVHSYRMSDDISERAQMDWDDAVVSELNLELERGISPEYAAELADNYAYQPAYHLLKLIEEQDKIINLNNVEDLKDETIESIEQSMAENYWDDMQDIYGDDKVFADDERSSDPTVYVIEEDAYTETFMQPDQYEADYNRSELTQIDFNKKSAEEMFSDNEMGVLNNYYEDQKLLKKIQKDSDIGVEYVEVEDQNGEPVTWFKVHLNKNIKRTAF